MWNLTALISILLMASLVMSTIVSKPNGRPIASKNHIDDGIGNLLGDDFGILAKLGEVEKFEITIEKTFKSRFSIGLAIGTQGNSSKPKEITSLQKPQISGCGKIPSGRIGSRIIGGKKVDEKGKFPWMVALLQEKRKGSWFPFCGGALISDRHVLTAAHCVEGDVPSNLMVRLGENNMNNSEASPSRRDVAVSAIFVHEGYDNSTQLNDIAILQLKERINRWTRMIRPICLPTEPFDFEGKNATVAGWGDQLEGSRKGSQYLMEVVVPIIGMNQCKESYSQGDLVRPIVKEQICAGYPDGGKDSCSGDSGGPLMFRRNREEPWIAIGVISYGYGCARKGSPGVYVRVESYYDWIQSKMAIK